MNRIPSLSALGGAGNHGNSNSANKINDNHVIFDMMTL
jgi:hypothetical protein